MTGIALLGSCVTHDALPDPPPGRPKMTIVSKTGLASLMAPKIDGLTLPRVLGSLTPGGWMERCVRADVAKTGLDQIERQCPDVLLVDFMDDRLPLFAAGGSVFCESHEFQESGLLSRAPFNTGLSIDRLSRAAWRLWSDGLDRFQSRVRHGALAGTRMVLHRAYMASRCTPADAATPLAAELTGEATKDWIRRTNALLVRQHLAFLRAFPDAVVIDVSAELRVADAAHIWGAGPFHYVPDYYAAFRERARAVGIDLGAGSVSLADRQHAHAPGR